MAQYVRVTIWAVVSLLTAVPIVWGISKIPVEPMAVSASTVWRPLEPTVLAALLRSRCLYQETAAGIRIMCPNGHWDRSR